MPSILDPAEILQLHKQYADEFTTLAQSGLQGAFSALSQSGLFHYNPASIHIAFPNFGQPNGVGPLPTLPEAPETPDLGDMKEYVDIPSPTFPQAPVNTLGRIPAFQSPAKPSVGTPSLTVAPPNVSTSLVMPTPPSYLALPSLVLPYTSIDIPTKPIITQPVFDGQRPDALSIPSADTIIDRYTAERDDHRTMLTTYTRENARALLATFVPEYETIRSRINGAIASYMDPTTGGGAGIPENIERGILARASERSVREGQKAISDSAGDIGRRGFFMPQGSFAAVLKQTAVGVADSLVKANTDLASKNLELEQANFQMMLKLGEQFDEKMLDVATQWMQLALQIDSNAIASAKEIVATYLGAYNLQVMVYKALWDGYVADTEVLKARISALDSSVRLYESEIRAELAKTEINKSQVEVLQAVAGVNQSLATTYRAQVDAATATLEVSRIQMQIYEARVRAFSAEVSAYEARWNAYRAEVDGEVAKVKGYEAQANAYTAQVTGYRAEIDGLVARVDALAKVNESIFQSNDAKLKVYATQSDIAIKTYEGLVAAYSAESNAIVQQANIEVEYWRTSSNLIFQEFNAALNQTFEYAREQMNLFRGQMEAAINAANGLSQAAAVAGNLAGGAMGGLTSFAGSLVSSQA